MHTLRTRIDDEIDYFGPPDIEPKRIKMWCPCCQANVETVKRDCGIGRDDAYGRTIIHYDWRDTCVVCGDDNLEGARSEEEIDS